MSVSFSGNWADEISSISELAEFQNCEIQLFEPAEGEPEVNYETGEITYPENIVHYSGQARFIPIRAGVYHGGEAQLNATTIRAARIQIPHSKHPGIIGTGWKVLFTSAPFNPSLEERIATVSDDFQGSTTASRTFNVYLDADAEVDDG